MLSENHSIGDSASLDENYVFAWIQAALARPEMYAQNAGSLEDQIILLLGMARPGKELFYLYTKFCFISFKRVTTASAYYDHNMKAVVAFLRDFFMSFNKDQKNI
jgi:hypothetical protein